MKPLLLITLPLLALVGCQTLEQEIVLPGVDESPPAVLLGHVPGGRVSSVLLRPPTGMKSPGIIGLALR